MLRNRLTHLCSGASIRIEGVAHSMEVNMAKETACSLVGASVIEVFADLVRVTVVVGAGVEVVGAG